MQSGFTFPLPWVLLPWVLLVNKTSVECFEGPGPCNFHQLPAVSPSQHVSGPTYFCPLSLASEEALARAVHGTRVVLRRSMAATGALTSAAWTSFLAAPHYIRDMEGACDTHRKLGRGNRAEASSLFGSPNHETVCAETLHHNQRDLEMQQRERRIHDDLSPPAATPAGRGLES